MDDFASAMKRNMHLKKYVYKIKKEYKKAPDFRATVSRDLKEMMYPNIIYPVGDPLFVHIFETPKRRREYIVIEPKIETGDERKRYDEVQDRVLELAPYHDSPKTEEEFKKLIGKLMDESTEVTQTRGTAQKKKRFNLLQRKFQLEKDERDKFLYMIKRDIIGVGVLESLIRDPYIEDIHVIGPENVSLIHKIFDTLPTNLTFDNDIYLMDYLKNMGERIGRPVSEGSPIVDGSLPDGSRINIIYSNDVSRKGSSFTIRKFSDTPISIVQLVNWNTLSSEEAAYFWICLEHGMSVFVCGETASGKTTTLNGILPFIKPKSKIYTAEDTAEVLPPHDIWQQLITREKGPEEGRVTLFELLKAALRSRPNYIIVGEIRGAEGAIAFQAMQTGHPVISTFHASSVKKMIQRFTGTPINVPVTFIDNLNVVLIQQAVYRKGKFLRRVTSVEEIEGYFTEIGGVATRSVFEWDSVTDKHIFRGLNNSYILETKIAETAGFEDPREIYDEMSLRARILEEMVANNIMEYHETTEIFRNYHKKGLKGLPFQI